MPAELRGDAFHMFEIEDADDRKGELNGDGQVTAADVIIALQRAAWAQDHAKHMKIGAVSFKYHGDVDPDYHETLRSTRQSYNIVVNLP